MSHQSFNAFTGAITAMVQESGATHRNLLKSFDDLKAAPIAKSAFAAFEESDLPTAKSILKACAGSQCAALTDWLEGHRSAASQEGCQGKA